MSAESFTVPSSEVEPTQIAIQLLDTNGSPDAYVSTMDTDGTSTDSDNVANAITFKNKFAALDYFYKVKDQYLVDGMLINFRLVKVTKDVTYSLTEI